MRALILVQWIGMAFCWALVVLVKLDEAGEQEAEASVPSELSLVLVKLDEAGEQKAVASVPNEPSLVLVKLDEAGGPEAVASAPNWPVAGRISAFDDFAPVLPGLHLYNESEHFIFWTTRNYPEPSWITLAEDSVGYVRGRLLVNPALSKAAVFFLRSRKEVRRLAGHLRPGARERDRLWNARSHFHITVPAIVILVSPRVAESIIHETTHYVVHGLGTPVPPAIDEGMATFVTGELLGIKGEYAARLGQIKRTRVRRLARVQDLPLLQHLVTMSYDEFHEEKAGYELSWCLGKVLLDKKSPWRQRLSDFLEGADRANPWTSFVRTYPVDKIESEWEAELFRQRSGK